MASEAGIKHTNLEEQLKGQVEYLQGQNESLFKQIEDLRSTERFKEHEHRVKQQVAQDASSQIQILNETLRVIQQVSCKTEISVDMLQDRTEVILDEIIRLSQMF